MDINKVSCIIHLAACLAHAVGLAAAHVTHINPSYGVSMKCMPASRYWATLVSLWADSESEVPKLQVNTDLSSITNVAMDVSKHMTAAMYSSCDQQQLIPTDFHTLTLALLANNTTAGLCQSVRVVASHCSLSNCSAQLCNAAPEHC